MRERGVQRLEIGQDLVLGQAVERRQRLVHQQQPGLREQRAADRDPLALAAREAQRRAVEQARDPEQLDDLVEARHFLGAARAALAGGHRADCRAPRDAGTGSPPGTRSRPAARGRAGRPALVLPDLAADREMAVAQHLQAGDAAQHGGLAAAGGAEQRGDAAASAPRTRRRARMCRACRESARRSRRCPRAHARSRPVRFSISIIARITAKENTSMPAGQDVRLGPAQRLDVVVDRDRQDLGLARDVAADHQHDAELADRVGEAEHGAGQEARPRQRHGDATRTRPSGEARRVAATSSGRSPMASKALRIGCTTNGIE